MNNQIETIKRRLLDLTLANRDAESKMTEQLQTELNKVFDASEAVQAIAKLTEGKPDGYTTNEAGEIESWYRIHNLEAIRTEFGQYMHYLEVYLNELTCGYVDFKNEAFIQSEGDDNIVINEDGDVFQGHKVIIDSKDYESKAQRNALIEKHMESTCYFPGVFREDHYGNLTLVSTVTK